MIKLAIYSMKGGTGKTITAANLGYMYAAHRTKMLPGTSSANDRKTLLLDLDPQGNLSQYYRVYQRDSTCGLETGEPVQVDWLDKKDNINLFILPGNTDIINIEERMRVEDINPIGNLENLPHCKMCDFWIMDCAPSFNRITISALCEADYLIIPVRLDSFSGNGLMELDDQLAEVKQLNHKLKVLGVLITHDEKTINSDEAERVLRSYFPVFETKISRSKWVSESTLMNAPLQLMGGKMSVKPAWQYRKLMNEIIKKIKEG